MGNYIKVFKKHSDKAGYYYTNIVRTNVTVFGQPATYQAGNSNGQKVHYWFVNADVPSDSLPDIAMAEIDGDVISVEDYNLLTSEQGIDVSSDSATEQQPASF